MITVERLEELIKNNALIYAIARDKEVFVSIQLNNNFSIITRPTSGNLLHKEHSNYLYSLDGLFETKEEVLHQLKYGNIDKTITLHLPTYKEFLQKGKSEYFYNYSRCYQLRLSKEFIKLEFTEDSEYWNTSSSWSINEENYDLACEKCKEIFLD